ncbi:hypothetical protein ACFLU1_02645 [Chloroflexota bacterium]
MDKKVGFIGPGIMGKPGIMSTLARSYCKYAFEEEWLCLDSALI